jgi:hypothetical protein
MGRCVELRWFVRRDAPAWTPKGSAVVRTDRYHLASLTPLRSVKLRGGTKLEGKVRVGTVEMLSVGAACGFAETWEKVAAPDPRPGRRDGWVDVRKELWRARGSEIGRLTVCGETWWTVCVDADAVGRERPPIPDAWVDLVAAHGEPHSYASWLLTRARTWSAMASLADADLLRRRRDGVTGPPPTARAARGGRRARVLTSGRP